MFGSIGRQREGIWLGHHFAGCNNSVQYSSVVSCTITLMTLISSTVYKSSYLLTYYNAKQSGTWHFKTWHNSDCPREPQHPILSPHWASPGAVSCHLGWSCNPASQSSPKREKLIADSSRTCMQNFTTLSFPATEKSVTVHYDKQTNTQYLNTSILLYGGMKINKQQKLVTMLQSNNAVPVTSLEYKAEGRFFAWNVMM